MSDFGPNRLKQARTKTAANSLADWYLKARVKLLLDASSIVDRRFQKGTVTKVTNEGHMKIRTYADSEWDEQVDLVAYISSEVFQNNIQVNVVTEKGRSVHEWKNLKVQQATPQAVADWIVETLNDHFGD